MYRAKHDGYDLTIREEICNGEKLFVGRVIDLPNISVVESTFQQTLEIICKTIEDIWK